MGHLPLLDELAIICVLSVVVTVLLSRLKLPAVAGLLAAGAIVGPFGLGLVQEVHAIEVLAEVGVVLLLFSIGLEFSLTRIRHIFAKVALGGAVQVGATIAAAIGISLAVGLSLAQGLFIGFIFALSSTAIVLRALEERRELDAPHGRIIVGTLIFQDLCVVPMVLIVPLLGAASNGDGAVMNIVVAMLKATVVVAGTIMLARYVVPKVLGWVDAAGSREVFLMAILAICIGTAWVTSKVGLSLALGAFLGGMVVADTEYSHRALGDILPLRDAFVSVFFVSLGMLFDISVVVHQPILVGCLLAAFLLGKGLLATIAALVMRFPARVAWLAGVGLAQFGEFSFVLAKLGTNYQVMSEATIAPILAAGIASMFFTPLLVRLAPHISAGETLLAPLERLIGVRGIDEAAGETAQMKDHVVIVGFGLAGRNAAKALAASGVPFVVLELNAENVRLGKARGFEVYYGDGTSLEALTHAGLEHAKMLVLLMNDPAAAKRVVDTASRVAPNVPVLMRTKYLTERETLLKMGASHVVIEEVEGAAAIITAMLAAFGQSTTAIESRLAEMRNRTS